jgi:hypothetical protein
MDFRVKEVGLAVIELNLQDAGVDPGVQGFEGLGFRV